MGMLLMLKEGGSLGIDTIGNLPIDEDIDLLPDAGGSLSFALRIAYEGLVVTSVTQTSTRAIVMGDS
jgi:hypothetical protein|tara:strand:+ start:2720 stop:2920 length:201 start_codon:yes stop_codon:yes gene_type:complete